MLLEPHRGDLDHLVLCRRVELGDARVDLRVDGLPAAAVIVHQQDVVLMPGLLPVVAVVVGALPGEEVEPDAIDRLGTDDALDRPLARPLGGDLALALGAGLRA
eukprot:scaffold136994_cov90-Phaeocystis_antarctica.AAC.1